VHGPGEVAVVVPLEEVDRVLAHQRVEPLEQIVPGFGIRHVEALLVPPRRAGQHPVGVGAGKVGIRVDHLGLHPQAELHPQAAHMVDERVQAVGPHVRVHVPVAEPRVVVAPAAEPAVVEHESLDADLCGPLGELS
jgi:hypothetical protein